MVLYMYVVYMCNCVHVYEYVSAHKREGRGREYMCVCLYKFWEFLYQKFLVHKAS